MTETKFRLILALAEMPSESFGWIALKLRKNGGIFPNGLGGFQDSEKIESVFKAAEKYIKDPKNE